MSLFTAVLFSGAILANYTAECVEGWSWIGNKKATYAQAGYYFSVYSNPNACLLYLAVGQDGNCYDVKRDSEGYYYVLLEGEWRKMY